MSGPERRPSAISRSLITLGQAHDGVRKRRWTPLVTLNRRHLQPLTISGLTAAAASPRLVPLRRRNAQLWQQNTHTGRLTGAMLDGVFLRARELLEEDPQTR
jgi:hypothetical protein